MYSANLLLVILALCSYNRLNYCNPIISNNMRIEQTIASTLTKRKLTLAIAESCTGGLLSDTLTNIPGSSVFFVGGIIAYAYFAKTKVLGVPSTLLKKHGAVSPQVASKMAQGVRKALKASFGIGITGIAGPGGATKNKPVGLVYIAINQAKQAHVHEFRFKGSRLQNKKQAVNAALRILLSMLE